MANDRLVNVTLTANTAPYVAGMNSATAATQRTATTATAASAGIQRTGSTMANTAGQAGLLRQGLTTPIAAAGAAIVGTTKASIDWESAWAGVTKTVDGSSTQMERLQGDLREMATELPATHGEIASVAEAAGQLGIKVDDVAEFSRVMIDLGETTNLSADQAATSLARFSNIMGTAEDDIERLGSSLVDLGNNSETTEAEILELATRMAAAGQIAGLSESDVLGFAAAVTSVGVPAEAAGTALSKTFQTMRDAVLDGGEALNTFAETAGMSAQQFATAFEEDPAAAIASFIEGLGRMNEQGQSTTGVFEDLGLNNERLKRALLSTAEAGDLLTDSVELGNEAWEENVALTEEAENRYGTTAARISASFGQIKDAAIDFGEPIAAGFADLVEGAASFASGLQKVDHWLKKASGTEEQGSMEKLGEGLRGLGVPEWMLLTDPSDDAAEGTESWLSQIRGAADDAIPQFVDALGGSAAATREADGAQEDLGAQVETTTDRLDTERDKLESLKSSMFDAAGETLSLRDAQRGFEAAVDDASDTIAANGETLDDSTDAGRENAESIDLIAERTHAQIQAMAEQGSSLEEVTEFTQNARDEFVNAAEAAGMEEDAAKALADQLGLVPEEVETKLEAINNAEATIERLEERLAELETRQVLIDIQARAVNDPASIVTPWMHSGGEVTSTGQIRRFHGGGAVDSTVPRFHSGVSRLASDEVPAILQRGEIVFSAEQSDHLRKAMAPMARGPMGGGSGASGFGEMAGPMTIENHIEIGGEVVRVVRTQISEHDRTLKSRTRAGTGLAR